MQNQHQYRLNVPLFEILKSIPETIGIRLNEEPFYQVVAKDEEFELRHYAPQIRAEVTEVGSTFNEFRENAFKKLANYIFGGNVLKENIPMTTPVLQYGFETASRAMSFILPARYNIYNLPAPQDNEVKIVEVPSYHAAVMTYHGNNNEQKIKQHFNRLIRWLKDRPDVEYLDHMTCAQYDAPFVIPFIKKNEVMIMVHIKWAQL